MPSRISRRDLLGQLAIGVLLTIPGVLALLDSEESPRKYISHYNLFNGDVKVSRTETTHRIEGADWIHSVKLEFNINQIGNYLFEGWVENYRATDSLGEKWEYSVDKVPNLYEENLKSLIYRLEATRVVNEGKIERDTLYFKNHGLADFDMKHS